MITPRDGGVAITLDTDWAPECCIDDVASMLIASQVRATWFVTHDSPAIDRLRNHPELFELGLHPNFFPGSSHGATEAAVLAHCARLVPDATAIRMHGLLQSSRLLTTIRAETGVRVDASLLLRLHPGLEPSSLPLSSGPLIRVPFWWEDDLEMLAPVPAWSLLPRFDAGVAGLKVLNFHPVHVAMDAATMEGYERLKARVTDLSQASAADVANASRGAVRGAGSAFREAVQWLSARGGGATISELAGVRGAMVGA